MAIRSLLESLSLQPEEASPLVEAYEAVLRSLDLVDRTDPVTELIAKRIIEIAKTGLRDAESISRQIIDEYGGAGTYF